MPSAHPARRTSTLIAAALTLIWIGGTGCNLPPTLLPPPKGGVCTIPPSQQPPVGAGSQLRTGAFASYLSDAATLPRARGTAAGRRLIGHVPAQARTAQDLGALGEDEALELTVSLPLNHVEELERLIGALHDPSSPSYGQYLKPDEFALRFGPTPDQVAQVRGYLESRGLSVRSVSTNRKLLRVSGSHAAVGHAFATEVHRYASSGGEAFYAPKYELELPQGLPIEAVHGLHNLKRHRPHSQQRRPETPSPLATGLGPFGGLTPAQLRTAYRFPSVSPGSGYDGSGQTLALFELDGYTASDVREYEDAFGLPHVPLTNVLVDGAPGFAGQGAGEVTLDLELMIAAAPGASRVLVYEGPNTDQGVLDTYNRIATDNLAQSVSTSWGAPEDQGMPSFFQAENSIFMQMAAQGQTLYAAAGDSGAYDNGRTVSVDDPATQPYVVAVGGTRLSTDGFGNYVSESTWNGGSPQGGAGGGGVSRLWTIPSWQQAAAAASAAQGSGVSTSMRNVPDVSLDADPQTGYAIFYQGQWTIFGGTSCAAPIYAGFTALVNQARASHGLGSIGLPHPALYQLAGQASSYAADFTDVADGSTNLYYPAVTAFDDATGLGSLKADGLLADLAQVPRPEVPAPSSGTGTNCPQ